MSVLQEIRSTYDVVVVGAGPAGSAAAYRLSTGGASVLIVDRQSFPRRKACGDVLTPRAVSLIRSMGIASLPGCRVRGIRGTNLESSHGDRGLLSVFDDEEPAVVIPRERLDALLLKQAVRAGATFVVATVEAIHAAGRHTVTIRTSGLSRRILAGSVIVAAGVIGGRMLGTRSRRDSAASGIAVRAYGHVDGEPPNELQTFLPINHGGKNVPGYGWIFPLSANRVNIGVGVFRKPEVTRLDVRALLLSFVTALDRRTDCVAPKVIDATIVAAPIGFGAEFLASERVLAVGDAAGLANPLSGEGIRYALESGELAARAILQAEAMPGTAYEDAARAAFELHGRLDPRRWGKRGMPQLYLRRGADLLTSPPSLAVTSVARMWRDDSRELSLLTRFETPQLRQAIESMRSKCCGHAYAARGALGVFLEGVISDPRSKFGWYAAYAAALAADEAGLSIAVAAGPSMDVEILELVNLVRVLQEALLPLDGGHGGARSWGQNSLLILLADTLNVRTLELLYRLPAQRCRQLSRAIARSMTLDAETRVGGAISYDERMEIESTLLAFAPAGRVTKSDIESGSPGGAAALRALADLRARGRAAADSDPGVRVESADLGVGSVVFELVNAIQAEEARVHADTTEPSMRAAVFGLRRSVG